MKLGDAMSLRHITYGLLTSDVDVVSMFETRIYDAGSLGTPTGKEIPAKPFVVMNFGAERPGPAGIVRVEDRVVDFWVYGEPGDYTRVERGLRLIKKAVHDKAGLFYTEEGEKTWLVSSRYQGSSSDLYDDVYRANARFGTYRLIGSTP